MMRCFLGDREIIADPTNLAPALFGNGPSDVEIRDNIIEDLRKFEAGELDFLVEGWHDLVKKDEKPDEKNTIPVYTVEILEKPYCYRLWIGKAKPGVEESSKK